MSLTTDPNDPCLVDGKQPEGQNVCYLVLSDEERAKGFVRPLRDTYLHVGIKPNTNIDIRDLTEEENERYGKFGYIAFLEYPKETGLLGKYFTKESLGDYLDGVKGCGTTTTMGKAIAETYARDPKFYGRTFCVTCNKHLPVDEFVWDGTDEILGS